eukprot:1814628-Alexandrium_andersonii.AAC.1
MSASLVGSEMCIRDRPKAPRKMTWRKTPCPPNTISKAGVRRHKAPHPPVSYTHLTLPTICSV